MKISIGKFLCSVIVGLGFLPAIIHNLRSDLHLRFDLQYAGVETGALIGFFILSLLIVILMSAILYFILLQNNIIKSVIFVVLLSVFAFMLNYLSFNVPILPHSISLYKSAIFVIYIVVYLVPIALLLQLGFYLFEKFKQ